MRSTFGRLQHIIQKIVNIHDLVGHWTLCDAKTKWNYENKCFYVETSLLSHCKSKKSCQKTKWCNFLTFTGTQMRKKPTRIRSYFKMESAMTAILRDASGKMHHGILFDRCLGFTRIWYTGRIRGELLLKSTISGVPTTLTPYPFPYCFSCSLLFQYAFCTVHTR